MQQDNCQNNFLYLPLELLDYIIQYNNAQDVVFAISVSCKTLASMTRNIEFLKRKIVQFHHQVLHALVHLSMNKHHVSELQALLYYFLRQFGLFVLNIYMLDLPVQMVATEQDGRIQEDEVRQLAKLDKQAREIVFSSNRSIFFRHFDINLQASKPIVLAQQLGCFFYEMTFLKQKCASIGLAHAKYSAESQPGWRSSSIAFHGDDGSIFGETGMGDRSYEQEIQEGDTIGCGVMENVTFFTHNNELVKFAARIPAAHVGMIPTIGMFQDEPHESRIRYNFGQTVPFVFDLSKLASVCMKEAYLLPQLANPNSEQINEFDNDDMNSISMESNYSEEDEELPASDNDEFIVPPRFFEQYEDQNHTDNE